MWTFPVDFIIYIIAVTITMIFKSGIASNKLALNLDRTHIRALTTVSSSGVPISVSSKLSPWYITGFADAEGSFSISISASKNYSTGFLVKMLFDIGLDKRDRALLEMIQSHFGVGKIYDRGQSVINYRAQSIEELGVIINHFDQYPLITQKWADYLLFKQAFELIKNKEHLTIEGLQKIVNIKASMNNGLSEKLKAALLSVLINPVERPELKDQIIPDPQWLVGFVDGEGCFYVSVQKSKVLLGEAVKLKFQLTQHVRDLSLLKSLDNYFGCGRVEVSSKGWACYVVTVFSDVLNKIVPFFESSPLQGVKRENFEDFCRVVSLLKNKEHLTKDGLEKIKQIKLVMNKKRKYDN